jgi:2-polyprenyl-3-methyl-5-hydroxy-6-metoxy-1,4-benzoquinol methylase
VSTSPLTPGQIARKVLGRHFEPVGNAYRRIFVDLNKIAEALDNLIPKGSRILDVGGGDGALIDRLLDRRPDLIVTMCDLAPEIGSFLSNANRAKVRLLPATDFTDVGGKYDFVTLSDVVHHVPLDLRASFFALLAQHCSRWGCRNLVVKDIEPGTLRATLAKWMDWYVTGDRHVMPFSRSQLAKLVGRYFPQARRESAMPDSPNYCELLSW